MSKGDRAAVEALLQHEFWRWPLQDGRSSKAMLNLIDQVRQLRTTFPELDILPFDGRGDVDAEGDLRLAIPVNQHIEKRQPDLMIILVGNFHNKRTGKLSDKPSMVDSLNFPSKSYLLKDGGGSYFNIAQNDKGEFVSGIQTYESELESSLAVARSLRDANPVAGYDGALYIGRISASLPVVVSK